MRLRLNSALLPAVAVSLMLWVLIGIGMDAGIAWMMMQ